MPRARPSLLLALPLVLLVGCQRSPPPPEPGARRIVSMSPAISETLFALGAGDTVVGLSDYTDFPPQTAAVPKVGTTLTPHYEAIARLKPTLILDQEVKQTPTESLASLAPMKVLPWFTVEDMAKSILELGRLTGHAPEAEKLADRVRTTLGRKAPPDAPRVLLVLGDPGGTLSSIWYMRHDSLHGAALEAAGARNALGEESAGPPNLSIERLISLDPDAVIVLVEGPRLTPEEQAKQLAPWKQLTALRAVKQDRVKLVHGPGVQATGPRILDLVEQLRAALGNTTPPP